MPLPNGETFAGFRIMRLLGSGGMGEVYLAEHPRLPRREALKILPAEVSADSDFRNRFNREADLAATLFHPHIVGVHDRGEFDGQLWISMDYVDGTDTAQLLRQRYPAGMPRDEAVDIVSAIADALDYAHDHGLLHRDVKPANILLTEPRKGGLRILLADFGIARSLNDISGLTATNMTIGSVNYAAPEQLMGDDDIDGRADQYSLAATAYHLLTGSPPFEHSNPAVVISHHLNARPRALSANRPELVDLDNVICTALSKDRADRFPSCRDFADALKGKERPQPKSGAAETVAALTKPATVPSRAKATQEATSDTTRSKLTRPAVALPMILATVLVAALAVAGWQMTRGHDSAPTGQSAAPASQTSTPRTLPPPSPPPAAASPAPPAPTATPTNNPALTGPAEGSDCAHAQINAVTTSNSGKPIRCTSGPGGYSWQPDTGTDSPDPAIIGQIGWDNCIKQFPQAKCVASAAAIVDSPNTSGPVFPEGTYNVPDTMPFGTYAAIPWPKGGCAFYIYDSTGKLYNSGSYTNAFDKPVVEVNPFASKGRFQTVGCSPWVMIKPLSPDW